MQRESVESLPVEISSALAPELVDQIIDQCYGSRTTLSNCSVVCKSWLPRCRYHLFQEVNLSSDLVEFLQSSPFETVTPYITHVAVGGNWLQTFRQQDAIATFLYGLSNIKEVSFEAWTWDHLIYPFATSLHASPTIFFDRVTALHFNYVHLPSFPLLEQLLSRFHHLRRLTFNNITCASDHDVSLAISVHPPPKYIKHLAIRSCSIRPLLSWLFPNDLCAELPYSQRVPIFLTSLVLLEIQPGDRCMVGTVVHTLGRSLQHLEVGFLSLDSTSDVSRWMSLSNNSNLQELHIHGITLFDFSPFSSPILTHMATSFPLTPPTQHTPYAWLVPFLATVNPSALTTVAFHMWITSETHLDMLDWRALNNVFCTFDKLRHVEFHLSGTDVDVAELCDWFESRLDQKRGYVLDLGLAHLKR